LTKILNARSILQHFIRLDLTAEQELSEIYSAPLVEIRFKHKMLAGHIKIDKKLTGQIKYLKLKGNQEVQMKNEKSRANY